MTGRMAPMSELEKFLMGAYAALLFRGYRSEQEIEDPILREVWRRGRKVAEQYSSTGSKSGGRR